MADLMPSMSSDDEEENVSTKSSKKIRRQNNKTDSDDEDDDDEGLDKDFSFGGVLGEDGGWSSQRNGWSYQSALDLLEENDSKTLSGKVPRMDIANIIAAKRKTIKQKISKDEPIEKVKKEQDEGEDESEQSDPEALDDDDDDDEEEEGGVSEEENQSREKHKTEQDDDGDGDESGSEDSEDDEVDDSKKKMEGDELKTRAGQEEDEDEGDDNESKNEDAEEVAKAAAYFETAEAMPNEEVQLFSQLALSRPLLRGVASMGFVKPTPVQASVIPVALAGRDVCASAVTGSGKTAAFILPVLERVSHRAPGSIKALILTPTRELAAQCLGMMSTIAQFTKVRSSLVVGGARNVNAQAAELRSRPDVVVATPGRLLDHVTNSAGVVLDDVDFLVLDEADRLLDLGFQDEVHELIRSCPEQRQTLLFSATMTTRVDDLIKLSLKQPVRIKVSNKDRSQSAQVEVAPRLEQEFVRVRAGNEGINREGMLLALLTRTFTTKTIAFFDTKSTAHRIMILAGLCGIKCSELHGNLSQMQRLSALEQFRKGEVDVLLATDLAARGLDVDHVQAVINFEMPTQVETYVHRIGRTARAGRGGRSCTLIGEGRRHLMKEVIKDAEQKAGSKTKNGKAGIIRSRTIPPGVVAHFVRKIKSLEPHVEEVLQAEAVAKMDRIAEMEVVRAQNIIQHADEIKSRPQREWFATTKQKELAKERAAAKAQMIAEKTGTGTHRMNRKKRRARKAKEEFLKFQEESRREAEAKGQQPKRIVTDQTMKSSARAQKKEAEMKEKARHSESLHDEAEKKRAHIDKQKKRKGAFALDAAGDSSLFGQERITHSNKKANEEERPSSYHFRGYDPSRDGKKRKQKSHHGFKSKSKYKRRK